jgi:protein subunit release factor A
VHATHRPSGLHVFVQDQRDQIQNRRVAIERLRQLLLEKFNDTESLERVAAIERAQRLLSQRGSQFVRTYDLTRDAAIAGHLLNGNLEEATKNSMEVEFNYLVQLASKSVADEIHLIEAK